MFDMDGLPDLLKPCRGGFETGQDRGEESLQFIQVAILASFLCFVDNKTNSRKS